MSDTDHDHLLNAMAQSSRGPTPADTRIIERCRDIAVGSLSGTLKGMLENLVDEFFMLADKAVLNETQNLYFEAMSVVRDQREKIENGFRDHFIRGFDTAVRGETDVHKNSNFDEQGEFDLVDADALEESIAIQEMTAKMKAGSREELFALDKRMGVLLHDAELKQHKNPLGAEVMANAFIAACGETDARLKVRLLLVTMWDRQMQNGVHSMYHEINQYLVEKNILPKIKHEIKRKDFSQVEQIASAAAHAAVQAMAMSEEDGDVFETMRHLFSAAAARGGVPGVPGMTGMMGSAGVIGQAGMPGGPGAAGMAGMPGMMGMPGFSGVPGVPGVGSASDAASTGVAGAGNAPLGNAGVAYAYAHNPMLLTQLTQLQHGDTAVLGVGGAIDGAMVAVGNTNVLRELKSSELATSLGSADAMTIDIVAMLFDFIFDDKRVPDPIKALLGRLQIPVLKAAMLDQAFFSKKSHPTRRLLNAMAEAANGWDEEITHDSPLYQKVEQIVQRINAEFEDKLDVFEQALDAFQQFMAERESAADALAEVSIDMIEAREREQIKEEDAQLAAEDAVRSRAADMEVPDTVRLFLCKEWITPLRDAYLHGGSESHAWLKAVGLMDDLIWSVRPKMTRESRQYMVKTLPALLRRLQEGMQLAEIPQATRDQFMSQLVQCHAAAVKAGFQTPVEPQPVPEEAWKAAVLARQASNKEQAQESAVVLPFARPERVADEGEVKLEIIQAQSEEGKLHVEEITIGSVGWNDADELDDSAVEVSSEMEVLDQSSAKHLVAELKPGAWVEFRHEGEETMHAKLKWISPLKSAYLFTDRQGKRAATMPLEKLEAAFRIGSARIVDDLPLLDRAVGNVIEALKKAAA